MQPNWAFKEKRFKCSEGVNRWPSRLSIHSFSKRSFFPLYKHPPPNLHPAAALHLSPSPSPQHWPLDWVRQEEERGEAVWMGECREGRAVHAFAKLRSGCVQPRALQKWRIKWQQFRHFSVRERSTRWDPASGMSLLLMTVYGWMK